MSNAALTELVDCAPPLPIMRFTVDQYHSLIKCGAIEEGAPYELLEGWIVHKMSRNSAHEYVVLALLQILQKLVPPDSHVRIQTAITLEDSEPEPDLFVAMGGIKDYEGELPDASSARLVIEISNTSLERDRTLKNRIYARAGIPEYWVVNLADRCVEVYSKPGGKSNPVYKSIKLLRENERVPLPFKAKKPGSVSVKDILPSA